MGLQASAIYTAGRAHLSAWLPRCMEILEGDDPELRFEAVRAVGLLGDVESLPQLSEVALKDEDVDVRQSAITAIGVIGGPAATRVLRRLMERAPEADHEVIEDALNEASLDEAASFDDGL